MVSEFEGVKSSVAIKFLSAISLLSEENCLKHIQTEWGEVKPKATCKYLGLTMDTKLQWKAHIEEIRRKTTKTVNALSCLGGSTWGVGLMDMRGIYEGTALPQMMYTCSIWSNGSTKGKTYTKKTLEALRSVQARAARTICGAWVKPVGMRLGQE
ncbi:uncharacterized protein K441DRAFT_590838 [Cenococcum geophilum 1.58]|uniref:Uncharacterized protein n=1 Tax=Cenococcum geophilum 1.58 TaxID=794803 RepID=A0ACC8EPE9_9PEZI|nr:hypothetical protein K441DRAFT_590838 [Cenococcum geophilum 1.58]